MSALALLLTIVSALLVQVASGAALWILRKRKDGLALRAAPSAADPSALPVAAWSGWRDFRVTARTYEDAEHSQCSFHLATVDGQTLADFQPGQYVVLQLDVAPVSAQSPSGAVPITRCYSLSERPHPSGWRITVKRALAPLGALALPAGLASGYLLDMVHVGSVLKARAPAGQFVLEADASVPAVFVAGGIGITPLMSMLQWCLIEQAGRALYLYYGVRSSADHAFKTTLETLAASHPALTLQVVYSAAGSHDVQGRDYHHIGFIDVDLLRSTLPLGRHQWYLCGPPAYAGQSGAGTSRMGERSARHSSGGLRTSFGTRRSIHAIRTTAGGLGGASGPYRPYPRVGRAGRQLARFCRAQRRAPGVGLPRRQLWRLPDAADVGRCALPRSAPAHHSRGLLPALYRHTRLGAVAGRLSHPPWPP
jgi:ferredoxin-NADP reductase